MSRLAILLVLSVPLHAAELRSITVEHAQGVYTMRSEVWFDAGIEPVYEVFSRWDYSSEFSSAVVDARDIEPDGLGRPQFYVRNRGCVLFFCKSFERRGYVESHPTEELKAFTDPETSDFHISDEVWTFVEGDGGTIVTYDLRMKPKFWIPPGIGPYMLKRKLKKDGGRAIDRIEAIAQRVAQRSGDD